LTKSNADSAEGAELNGRPNGVDSRSMRNANT
jgi:hypothetical protein